MRITVLHNIDDVHAEEWNALVGTDNPFLKHEFLAALERRGCVGERFGWIPRHLLARDEANNGLVGALPMYLKENSYGEFVFDWSWADACQRMGRPYYPKLVVAIPYTPVTGPRVLTAAHADHNMVARSLVNRAIQMAMNEGLSSLHLLFTTGEQTTELEELGLLRRTGCQFHWQNPGYRDFHEFLAQLNSRKRKKISRERRHVREAGIEMRVLHGDEADEMQLDCIHDFYRSTFVKKSGIPTLTREFFREICTTMGRNVVLALAYRGKVPVAGAINLRSNDILYGRHWGCRETHHSLHFETCYYTGIDYCIEHGLKSFEPGAQGEHKISRGFLPAFTWSAHWIADERFRGAIGRYLQHEDAAMKDYCEELLSSSPYRAI
jgi:predicted N-acyltransferase